MHSKRTSSGVPAEDQHPEHECREDANAPRLEPRIRLEQLVGHVSNRYSEHREVDVAIPSQPRTILTPMRLRYAILPLMPVRIQIDRYEL